MSITEQNLSKKERHELRRQEKLAARESGAQKKKTTRIMLWSFIVIFVAGTVALMAVISSKNPSAQILSGTVKAANSSDWIEGVPLNDAKVTLIEYSDFQCPACAAYYSMVKQLGHEFKNISVVYRHFPLPQHTNSRAAAQAAEAAGKQGKFWEMHNMLFENQNTWSVLSSAEETFNAYAKTLGLDMEKFKIDFNSSEIKAKIEADYQSGADQINGTPTFFLNDKKIQNPRNYDEFRSIIQQAGGAI